MSRMRPRDSDRGYERGGRDDRRRYDRGGRRGYEGGRDRQDFGRRGRDDRDFGRGGGGRFRRGSRGRGGGRRGGRRDPQPRLDLHLDTCSIESNFFKVTASSNNARLIKYRVDFQPPPPENATAYDNLALFRPHQAHFRDILGPYFSFDRSCLIISPRDIGDEEKTSVLEGGQTCKIRKVETITLEQARRDESVENAFKQMVNIIFKSLLVRNGYTRFDRILMERKAEPRQFFDRGVNINLFNAYAATVFLGNSGPLLQVDSLTKIVQTRSVRDLMDEWEDDLRRRYRGAPEEELERRTAELCHENLAGKCVQTRYNNFLYRILEIDWSQNPRTSTFPLRDGGEKSFGDYYREKYGSLAERIQNRAGLLEVARGGRMRRRDAGEASAEERKRKIFLIPELCYLTGLPDEVKDPHLMHREIAKQTKVPANERLALISAMIMRLTRGPGDTSGSEGRRGQEQEPPPVKFSTTPLQMHKVPILGPFKLRYMHIEGKEKDMKIFKTEKNDWNKELRDFSLELKKARGNPFLQRFVVCCFDPRDRRAAEKWINETAQAARRYNFPFPRGDRIRSVEVRNWRADFVPMMKEEKRAGRFTLIAIIPNRENEAIYNFVKQQCIHELGITSQCVKASNMGKEGGRLAPVICNTLKQILTKHGARNWYFVGDHPVNQKFRGEPTMLMGIVVSKKRGSNERAFICVVATVDREFSQYIWRARCVRDNEDPREVVGEVASKMAEIFCHQNKVRLRNLLIYRGGVSAAALRTTVRAEYRIMKEKFREMKALPDGAGPPNPAMTMVVVQKRPADRYFLKQDGRNFSPFPGTYISSRAETADVGMRSFCLVHCKPHPNQGTTVPTKYTVVEHKVDRTVSGEEVKLEESIEDQIFGGFSREKFLAYFTMQQCYMYCNWGGAVRAPAPLQYCDKLARLMTESVDQAMSGDFAVNPTFEGPNMAFI